MAGRKSNLAISPLTTMRLHTRTILRDGTQAFVGSQSLRQAELDARREIGLIFREPKVVKGLLAIFEKDWEATGYEDTRQTAKEELMEDKSREKEKATKALAKEMPPLQTTLKKAIKQAVARAGKEAVSNGELKSTVKDAVKTAVKEAVHEMVHEADD